MGDGSDGRPTLSIDQLLELGRAHLRYQQIQSAKPRVLRLLDGCCNGSKGTVTSLVQPIIDKCAHSHWSALSALTLEHAHYSHDAVLLLALVRARSAVDNTATMTDISRVLSEWDALYEKRALLASVAIPVEGRYCYEPLWTLSLADQCQAQLLSSMMGNSQQSIQQLASNIATARARQRHSIASVFGSHCNAMSLAAINRYQLLPPLHVVLASKPLSSLPSVDQLVDAIQQRPQTGIISTNTNGDSDAAQSLASVTRDWPQHSINHSLDDMLCRAFDFRSPSSTTHTLQQRLALSFALKSSQPALSTCPDVADELRTISRSLRAPLTLATQWQSITDDSHVMTTIDLQLVTLSLSLQRSLTNQAKVSLSDNPEQYVSDYVRQVQSIVASLSTITNTGVDASDCVDRLCRSLARYSERQWQRFSECQAPNQTLAAFIAHSDLAHTAAAVRSISPPSLSCAFAPIIDRCCQQLTQHGSLIVECAVQSWLRWIDSQWPVIFARKRRQTLLVQKFYPSALPLSSELDGRSLAQSSPLLMLVSEYLLSPLMVPVMRSLHPSTATAVFPSLSTRMIVGFFDYALSNGVEVNGNGAMRLSKELDWIEQHHPNAIGSSDALLRARAMLHVCQHCKYYLVLEQRASNKLRRSSVAPAPNDSASENSAMPGLALKEDLPRWLAQCSSKHHRQYKHGIGIQPSGAMCVIS